MKHAKNTAVFAYAFSFALFYTVSGIFLPYFRETYQVSLSLSGTVVSLQSLGELAGMALGGLLGKRMDGKKGLCLSAALLALLLLLIGIRPPFPVLMAAFFLTGICSGIYILSGSLTITQAYPNTISRHMNLLYASFGAGSFLGPYLPTFLFGRGLLWAGVYRIYGISCVLIAVVLYAAVGRENEGAETGGRICSRLEHEKGTIGEKKTGKNKPGKNKSVPAGKLVHPSFLLLCLAGFLYIGHQIGAISWIPSYFRDLRGMGQGAVSMLQSAYFLGMIAGRLLCSVRFTGETMQKYCLTAGNIAGGLCFAAAVYLQTPIACGGLLFLAGTMTGATYPLLISSGCAAHPDQAARITSILGVVSSLGGAAVSATAGMVAQRFTYTPAMLFIGALPVLCGCCMLIRKRISGS